ncbi:PREDICTED: putative receptor-like protein kinase At2g30940 [Camelina sativa]|uniref:non-specific serine/threonine protein kinase n=1 Tax=Camelina sativa TaxID=90675 RepID=A0ABM0WP21_CAMSA|nr:PREDICTED: putative receptor-like protein kinase At2g30940 [Camelina sativa]
MQKQWLEILLFHTLIDSSSLSPQRLRVMNILISKQRSDLIQHKLSQHTSFFGIKLWILITASASIAFFLVLIISIFLCYIFHRRKCRQEPFRLRSKLCLPLSHIPLNNKRQIPYNRCGDDVESQRISQAGWSSARLSTYIHSFSSTGSFGSFNVFTFMEIKNVTDGFAEYNLIARGDSSTVYRGVLMGTVTVAVKRFFPIHQRYEDKDFITRAEMIANVRHKNVVRLLGYCIEGDERVLVYEYAEKGDLHQWLHGSAGRNRPLTWRKRMKIIQGVAKGIAYVHEDIEPKITHQDIRPSKILLDYQWNPKILDVGFIGHSEIPTFVPSPGNLDEKIDVHCFGTLIMELVSGRVSVDQSLPHVYLVDWIKEMVANHMIVDVLDPTLPEFPTMKELKRIVLIALRCVDPEIEERPKMGDVIHMLQPHDLLLSNNAIQTPHKIIRSHEVSAISIRQ